MFYNPRLDLLAELQECGILLLIEEPSMFMVLTDEWIEL